ncbi:MAG: leucine-rich repeat protein [Bacteroidaceae bacterium]|nr:leucine-rich repeat protein [Bacteroidaceae bacterium]
MQKIYFKSFTLLTFLFCSLPAWAQTVVNVEKAGTLSSLLESSDSELKVTGYINGTDIKYLRQLTNQGGVKSLDLSEVRIVSGGTAYVDDFKTENDVIGKNMFKECTKLRSILLPQTVTAILSGAFANSGITEIDIPNSVSQLGSDAFSYCSALSKVVIGSRVSKMDQGVFYSSEVRNAYVKPMVPPSTPAYLFSSRPTIRVYSDVLSDYKQSSWAQYGAIVGKLEKFYPMEVDSSKIVNELRSTFFEDAACTTLKAEYQAMSDEALTAALQEAGMPQFMTAIALKLKNETWGNYEKDFRIHSYGAYSDASYWNTKLKSTGGSYMGNPTGIYTSDLNPLYVFVDEEVPEDATLYIAGCVDNDLITSAQKGSKLSKGLNIIDGAKNALYYIIYTADTREMNKTLSEWPTIKIHIEGGTVNGYYDVSRHSDADYKALLRAATHNLFTVHGEHSLFNFKRASYRKIWPSTIDRSISWFDSVSVWHKDLMGYSLAVYSGQRANPPYCLTGGEAIFPIYYNNPNFAIEGAEGDAGYANSTPYRTSYNSQDCIRNSFDVSRYEMDDWCSNHECGHNNQGTINLEGGTEVSNNLFANVVRYLDGLVTSTGNPLSDVMNEYAHREPYFIRDVNSQLRMYYQLYLYYHQAQKNTSFYPNLFKALREDPLTVWGNSNNSALKFVRKVCEVAQEDLTEFFTAYGFFKPFTNLKIEDYGAHTMTLRQSDINKTLAEISQYPKNREILFVEDRSQYVLTTDFLTTAGQKRRGSEVVGQYGDLGQFTDFFNGTAPSSYTYLQSDSLYALEGNGGVGFLMLDEDQQLVYAANSYNFCIPSCAGEGFTIYSVDQGGTLHEVEFAGSGTQEVWITKPGTLPDTLSSKVIKAIVGGNINGTDFKLMRQLITEGNLASIDLSQAKILSGGSAYNQSYRTTANVLGQHTFDDCKQLIAIQLPEKITSIGTCAFSHSGLNEVTIPDAVVSVAEDAFAYCKGLRRVIIGSKVRNLAKGAFYDSKVKDVFVKPLTPPSVNSYLFSSKPTIHVYASALAAYKASGWAEYGTIVGDLDDYGDITFVEAPRQTSASSAPAPVYDLFGRRVTHLQPGTIYIRGGRKFITR